jgi:hypothetical protein
LIGVVPDRWARLDSLVHENQADAFHPVHTRSRARPAVEFRLSADASPHGPIVDVLQNRLPVLEFQRGGIETLCPVDAVFERVGLFAPPFFSGVVIGIERHKQLPGPVSVFAIEVFGGLTLHIPHEAGDAGFGPTLEQPVSLTVGEAVVVDHDTILRGFLPEQGNAEGEVFVIQEDPLTLVTALDDVVEEVRLEVASRSRHGSSEATDGPKLEDLVMIGPRSGRRCVERLESLWKTEIAGRKAAIDATAG